MKAYSKTKILLVDDHRIVRQGVKVLLRQEQDLQVVGEADNADDAFKKASELRPDIVIMDIHISSGNGIEASRHILAAHPATKIIVLSGDLDPETINRALHAGISGYVIKMAASEELIRAIHNVRLGRIYLCPTVTTLLIRSNNFTAATAIEPVLTERETEMLRFIAVGLRNKEIAEQLKLGIKTIEANRSRLMAKLNCTCAAELVRYALRKGLVSP